MLLHALGQRVVHVAHDLNVPHQFVALENSHQMRGVIVFERQIAHPVKSYVVMLPISS